MKLFFALLAVVAILEPAKSGYCLTIKKEKTLANEELLQRIIAANPDHRSALQSNQTEVKLTELPFYKNNRLLNATVFMRTHPLLLSYLDDGKRIDVDQSGAVIIKKNEKISMDLLVRYLDR